MEPTIMTVEGEYFHFCLPERCEFGIEVIAHALSNICRFSGHTKKFYSVAQHSVLVSYLTPPEFAYEGLMHDAHEAFIGDVTSPLKRLIGPAFKEIERRIERAVRERFYLSAEFPPEVHHADMVALATEKRDLMNVKPDDPYVWKPIEGIEPHFKIITPWNPLKAKMMFLERYNELFAARFYQKAEA